MLKKQADDIQQNADEANDLVLLANTPAQAKSQLHSLEQVKDDISLHIN